MRLRIYEESERRVAAVGYVELQLGLEDLATRVLVPEVQEVDGEQKVVSFLLVDKESFDAS